MDIWDSLSATSKTLMFKEQFYGLFLISLQKEFSDRIGTACVSKQGINVQLTICPEFWMKLTDPTKVGVLKHELLHIAMGHLDSQVKFVDKQLFNIAADIEINQYIGDAWKGKDWIGLELKNYPELKMQEKQGTKMYYDLLDTINKKRQQKGLGNQGQGQPQPGQGQGQPQQGQGNQPSQQGQPGQGQGQPQPGQGQGGQPQKSQNDGSCAEKSKIWDVYDQMKNGVKSIYSHELWKEFYEGLSEAEQKLVKKQIEYQLKQVAEDIKKSRGTIPGEMQGLIDNLYKIEEEVIDWKHWLRRYGSNSNKIFTKKSRHKLNKRYPDNPAIKIKQKKTVLVARDTSGSVSDSDHKEFFSELHHIYKTGVRVFILDADAGVADLFEYKGQAPDHISGRGGTDFDPAIKFYNENFKNYDSFIYLTDGCCPAPRTKPRTQMLWVISSGGTMEYTKDFPGKVVQITK